MKKIILTLMVCGSLEAFANMDKQCVVELLPQPEGLSSSGGGDRATIEYAIKKNDCERNNVLLVMMNSSLRETVTDAEVKNSFTFIASDFCRFDRNVLMSHNFLSCILYDKEGRTQ
ncbi:hypothetical protein N9W64_00585 [Gammaproteobacteria bacterium]|nr:hypothetical protein [Gammaproteobacteria bacterium]